MRGNAVRRLKNATTGYNLAKAGWTPPTRYDSFALVAGGGMGDVDRVVDLSLERAVALK